MSSSLLDALCSSVEADPSTIQEALDTMVTVLPAKAVDKYLLHDVWGHGWQASLLDFEKKYQDISGYNRHIHEGTEAYTKDFISCFDSGFSKERFAHLVGNEVIDRIPSGLTPVLAEMLADMMEYKFIEDHPELADQMPSSSLFKDRPVKMDLMIQDLQFYFKQCNKSLRLWLKSEKRQKATFDYLAVKGLQTETEKEILGFAQEIYDDSFRCEIDFKEVNGKVQCNLFTRLCLNYFTLHSVVISTYNEVRQAETQVDPALIQGLVDLMILSTGTFFEEKPRENMWYMDEYLGLYFLPLVRSIFI